MNEGWATYWHSTIMTQKVLTDAEVVDYADHHSGTVSTSPGSLNPYKLGLELFRDIEDRWNRGRFGKEYDECDDIARKHRWDRGLGLGRKKIFDVRRIYNDITFIDEFLTEEFCKEQKLFVYEFDPRKGEWFITSRNFDKIKQKLLFTMANAGQPIIYVEDGNYENRGELLLRHSHEGVDLKLDYAKDTLKNIQKIWTRPVHLETVIDKKKKHLSYDGKKHHEKSSS
jgi:stage V sporulation protein R